MNKVEMDGALVVHATSVILATWEDHSLRPAWANSL
jgi:hypothetical protein